MIGIILLIGIVKKNGIMMVDFAITAEREQRPAPRGGDPQGLPAALPPDHDDHDGGLLGGVPLMLGHGTGSELRQPLGCRHGRRAAAVSQALTLFTTPVIYLYLDKLSNWLSGGGPKQEEEPELLDDEQIVELPKAAE